MQAQLRQHQAGDELAALYRRRETVSALILSLERYERARVRWLQKRGQRTSQAAT